MTCEVCGRPITDAKSAYLRVVGWERPGRGMGGRSGSSLVLRKATGELAHAECVVRLQQKVSVDQGSLL